MKKDSNAGKESQIEGCILDADDGKRSLIDRYRREAKYTTESHHVSVTHTETENRRKRQGGYDADGTEGIRRKNKGLIPNPSHSQPPWEARHDDSIIIVASLPIVVTQQSQALFIGGCTVSFALTCRRHASETTRAGILPKINSHSVVKSTYMSFLDRIVGRSRSYASMHDDRMKMQMDPPIRNLDSQIREKVLARLSGRISKGAMGEILPRSEIFSKRDSVFPHFSFFQFNHFTSLLFFPLSERKCPRLFRQTIER